MKIETVEALGRAVRGMREQLGLTQSDLAMTAGTGVRFIVDAEKGKSTCQVGKVLLLLQTLGASLEIEPPPHLSPGKDPKDAEGASDVQDA